VKGGEREREIRTFIYQEAGMSLTPGGGNREEFICEHKFPQMRFCTAAMSSSCKRFDAKGYLTLISSILQLLLSSPKERMLENVCQ
jgi:hypothetical protein